MSNRSIHENGKLLVEVGSKVVTRDGSFKGRILDTVLKGSNYPVIAAIDKGEKEEIIHYTNLGSYMGNGCESDLDIFLPPKKRTLRLYKDLNITSDFVAVDAEDQMQCRTYDDCDNYKFHSEIEIED